MNCSVLKGALAAVLLAAPGLAQIPPGYYDSVNDSSPTLLRQTLHAVIDDHQRFPYTSGATDTWDILELKQQLPSNANRVLDVYRNIDFPKQGGGNSFYNREHTWPNSYGFPNDNGSNYPYTDCHALFLSDIGYNSDRGSKPFRNCPSGCTERTTLVNNGQGGGTGGYPGNSNWFSGSGASGSWETWIGRRGDVARVILYMDIRYEGGTHGTTGAAEPNLIVTDNQSLIAGSQTGGNLSVAYMGMLSQLLVWHAEDPVDDFERNGNDVVFGFQGNRNPFVDHPEWVDCLYGGVCGNGIGTNYCSLTPNSAGPGAAITATGSVLLADNNFAVECDGLPAGVPGLFFLGPNSVQVPFGDGFRCVGGATKRLQPVQFANGSGSLDRTIDLTNPVLSGFFTLGNATNFQFWYRDGAAGGSGFNLSDAVQIVWQ